MKKAKDEGTQRVAEEKANAARVALELEAERIRQEKELKEAEAKRVLEARRAEDARKAEDARMVLLRQKARSPEIKRLLAPLLAKGYTQPRSGGSFDNTGELQPMSLQALCGTGCLDKGDRGMHTMLHIMSGTHSGNDRKVLWTHSYSGAWYDQMRDDVIAAQQAIRELGPALVAEGFLSP